MQWTDTPVTRVVCLLAVCLSLAACKSKPDLARAAQGASTEFEQQLTAAGVAGPDSCNDPELDDPVVKAAETKVFSGASQLTVESLNSSSGASAADRTNAGIRSLESVSRRVNVGWPDGNRFHAQVVEMSPLLVMTMTFRSQARFAVFAVTEAEGEKQARRWAEIGEDESAEHEALWSSVTIYPLHRGPSGRARFLARYFYSGCAGSFGEIYDAREWYPIIGWRTYAVRQAGRDSWYGRRT